MRKTAQEDAEKLKADYEARLANVDKEADEILSAARAKALANEADIVAKAREEASQYHRPCACGSRTGKEKSGG